MRAPVRYAPGRAALEKDRNKEDQIRRFVLARSAMNGRSEVKSWLTAYVRGSKVTADQRAPSRGAWPVLKDPTPNLRICLCRDRVCSVNFASEAATNWGARALLHKARGQRQIEAVQANH